MEKIELVGEKRKARALGAAEACRRLLKERFGARRVILFGSLAGQGPWHGRSDIDLAVQGLAPDEFFAAYSACRDLLPQAWSWTCYHWKAFIQRCGRASWGRWRCLMIPFWR